MSLRALARAALVSLLLFSCNSESSSPSGSSGAVDSGTGGGPRPTTTLFAASIKTVTIEIDYAAGAAPYMGTLKDFGDPWGLFNASVLAIFDGKKTVSFPRSPKTSSIIACPGVSGVSGEVSAGDGVAVGPAMAAGDGASSDNRRPEARPDSS